MFPTPFQLRVPQHRNVQSTTQDVKPFLNSNILQYTNTLLFEGEAHSIQTIPLIREHLDSYLFKIRYKILDIDTSQNPIQTIFNPVQNNITGTYYRTIHQQSIPITIQHVSVTYFNKLIEYNENLEHPKNRPSHLENSPEKSYYFEVQSIETKLKRQSNPHYWLQQDIFQ